jgi:hypothetical protein
MIILFILFILLFIYLWSIDKDKEYLGEVSSLKLRLKDKEKELKKLKKELEYYKNSKKYDEYLYD